MANKKPDIFGRLPMRWAGAAAILAASLLFFFSYYDYGINLFDEGVLLEGIQRQIEGRMDFSKFCHYSAQYRFFSYVFPSTGADLLVIRAIWAVMRALTATFIFLVARRLMPWRWALLPVLLFLAAPGPWHKSLVPFLIFINIYAMVRTHETGRLLPYLGLALCLSFAIATHLYTGVLTLVPCVLINLAHTPNRPETEISNPRKRFLIYHGSFAAMLVASTLAMSDHIYQLRPRVFASQTLAVLRSDFRGSRTIVQHHLGLFPDFLGFFIVTTYVVVILVIMGFALWFSLRSKRATLPWPKQTTLEILYGIGIANLLKWPARFDTAHLLQNAAPVWILLAFLLYRSVQNHRQAATVFDRLRTMAGAGLLGLWTVGMFVFGTTSSHYYHGGIGYRLFEDTVMLRIPRAPVYVDQAKARWLEEMVNEIQRNTMEDEPILICASIPMMYYLADRKNPLVLPIFDRPENLFANPEEEILREIRASGTRLVVFRDESTDGVAENRVSHYAPNLFRAILTEYELVSEINGYQIRVLRDNRRAGSREVDH